MDAADSPERTVEAAIAGGIELFGICDHNSGVTFLRKDARLAPSVFVPDRMAPHVLERYFDHINLVKEKYESKIRVLRGIEVATHKNKPKSALPKDADISFFDYCMIENLDCRNTITDGDLFAFRARCGCEAVGVAHTDMFAFINRIGEKPYEYFSRMAKENIFWEMNVNYDSTHKFHEYAYVEEFLSNEERVAIVRESGVRLSVGFDMHRALDYIPERVRTYCKRISALGIKLAYE